MEYYADTAKPSPERVNHPLRIFARPVGCTFPLVIDTDICLCAAKRDDHHPVNAQVPFALKAMVPLHARFLQHDSTESCCFFYYDRLLI